MENKKMKEALSLGEWLGRKQAFGMMAGRCSAADAECLRQMRDEKKYRSLGLSWEGFCKTQIGISRAAADKSISLLNEFGPKFFELSAVVRITPEEYRRIAPAVTSEGVQHRGRLLEIAMHNAPALSEAVQELRQEAAAAAAEAEPAPAEDEALEQALDRAGKSVRAALDNFKRAGRMGLDPRQRLRLLQEIHHASTAIGRFTEEEVVTGKLFSQR
jgi:hypothetical protein